MFKKLFTTLIVTGLFLAFAMPSAAATTKVKVANNGYKSKNTVKINQTKVLASMQINLTNSSVKALQLGNTGLNTADKNTGCCADDVSIKTGDVTNTTEVTVTGGSNTADLTGCGGCEEAGLTKVVIANNGAYSTNQATVNTTDLTLVGQASVTQSSVGVIQLGNTGLNAADKNTGGSVSIETGDVENTVTVEVTGGSNEVTL